MALQLERLKSGETMGDELSAARIRSVAGVFNILGSSGVVISTPIVVTCVGALVMTLLGYRKDPPLAYTAALALYGTRNYAKVPLP